MKRKRVDNRRYAQTWWFVDYCRFAGVVPTKRQASKFRNKIGKAYTFNHHSSSKESKEKEEILLRVKLVFLRKLENIFNEYERI